MSKTILLLPKLSEKTYALSESRVYVLEVPTDVNKLSVAKAVEDQFEVKVKSVRITNIKGKPKRTRSLDGSRYTNSYGKRPDIKKAYVTLKEGFSLPFFAAVEEEEKTEQKAQEQVDKALKKQAEKDAKPKRGLRKKNTEETK